MAGLTLAEDQILDTGKNDRSPLRRARTKIRDFFANSPHAGPYADPGRREVSLPVGRSLGGGLTSRKSGRQTNWSSIAVSF